MSASNPLANVRPPPEDVIVLTCVDLFCSAIFVPVGGYIAWKHGKPGKATWPNLPSAAIFRIVADVYLLVNKNNPLIPSVVTGLTNAAILASILLTLAGILYTWYVTNIHKLSVLFDVTLEGENLGSADIAL